MTIILNEQDAQEFGVNTKNVVSVSVPLPTPENPEWMTFDGTWILDNGEW